MSTEYIINSEIVWSFLSYSHHACFLEVTYVRPKDESAFVILQI